MRLPVWALVVACACGGATPGDPGGGQAAHLLPAPLLPLGPPADAQTARAFQEALDACRVSGQPEPLTAFLAAHPDSAWEASVHVNLAHMARCACRPASALRHDDAARHDAPGIPDGWRNEAAAVL